MIRFSTAQIRDMNNHKENNGCQLPDFFTGQQIPVPLIIENFPMETVDYMETLDLQQGTISFNFQHDSSMNANESGGLQLSLRNSSGTRPGSDIARMHGDIMRDSTSANTINLTEVDVQTGTTIDDSLKGSPRELSVARKLVESSRNGEYLPPALSNNKHAPVRETSAERATDLATCGDRKESRKSTTGGKSTRSTKKRKLDFASDHCSSLEGYSHGFKCSFCGLESKFGGISRFKYHLVGDPNKNISTCEKVTDEVKVTAQKWLRSIDEKRERKSCIRRAMASDSSSRKDNRSKCKEKVFEDCSERANWSDRSERSDKTECLASESPRGKSIVKLPSGGMADQLCSTDIPSKSKRLIESSEDRMAKRIRALQGRCASDFKHFDRLGKSSDSCSIASTPSKATVAAARVESDLLYHKLKKTMESTTYENYKNMDLKLLMKEVRSSATALAIKAEIFIMRITQETEALVGQIQELSSDLTKAKKDLNKAHTEKEALAKQLTTCQADFQIAQSSLDKIVAEQKIAAAKAVEVFKAGAEFAEEYANGFRDCYAECVKANPGVPIDWEFAVPLLESPMESSVGDPLISIQDPTDQSFPAVEDPFADTVNYPPTTEPNIKEVVGEGT